MKTEHEFIADLNQFLACSNEDLCISGEVESKMTYYTLVLNSPWAFKDMVYMSDVLRDHISFKARKELPTKCLEFNNARKVFWFSEDNC